MLPIKIELHKDPVYIESEDDIIDGYEFKEMIDFVPEFLEGVWEEGAGNNTVLEQYIFQKEKGQYHYIATLKNQMGKSIYYCEYYYDQGGDIICFLIVDPQSEKYYVRLEAVATYEKIGDRKGDIA